MDEILRSIRTYLYEKSVSPLAGAFVLAWLVLNYRVLVILFSGDAYTEKFEAIDQYFYISATENHIWVNFLVGRLLQGLLYPALLALAYIFLYPFVAAPVYAFSLVRRQKLREIRQQSENARLLTVEESRHLYKRLSEIEARYSEDIESYERQVSSLQQTISRLENEIENFPASEPGVEDGHENEAEIEEYDNYIERSIENHPAGKFKLSDLFTASRWQRFPVTDRQELGRRFKSRVDRGDFVDVRSVGRSSNNEAVYEKFKPADQESRRPSGDKASSPTDQQIAVLRLAVGLKSGYGITAEDIADSLNLHVEEGRLLLGDLADLQLLTRIGETDDGEELYGLHTAGRRYLVEHGLLPVEQKEASGKLSLLHEDEIEDFNRAIERQQLNRDDFQLIESDLSKPTAGTGPLTGQVTITYKPTGISQTYSTGHGSTWTYMFQQHLSRGQFHN